MPDTTTHSQDPHDPSALRRIDEARQRVANAELRLQSAICLLRSAEAAIGEGEQSISVKRGAPFGLLEGVGEVPISDVHASGRSELQVVLEMLGVHLDYIAGVVSELDRNRGVQPEEHAPRFSVFSGSENSQAEALSFAKKTIRDRVYIGQRNVVDPIFGPVVGERAHNSSPSVDDAGAHSVGDGGGAGDASATPATEVTLEYLVAAVRDANLDIKSFRRIDEAALANYNESGRNVTKAIKDRTDSERALLDYLTGDRA